MGKARATVKNGGKAFPASWRPKSQYEPKGSKAGVRPAVLK